MPVKVQDVDLRLNLVADLYLKGHSLRFIAGLLQKDHGVKASHQTVFNDVKALREQWKAERMEAYETSLATELEKLDRVEVAAWQGWERSLSIMQKRTKQKGRPDGGSIMTIEASTDTYEADSAGDPRFLAIIAKVSEQRSRLLGLFQKEEKSQNDAAVPTGQLPASFTESPTFVVVGGTMDMIESEDDLPEDSDE